MKSMGGHMKYVRVMMATDKSLYLDTGNLYCDIYIYIYVCVCVCVCVCFIIRKKVLDHK